MAIDERLAREGKGSRSVREDGQKASVGFEQKYLDLFENANDLIYTLDLQGNITSANLACERLTEYSRAQLLTMNIADLLASPENLALARQMISRKAAGRERISVYELNILTRTGSIVTLEVNSHIVRRDGEPPEVAGFARDVTFRRGAEWALAESEERFRSLVTELPAVVVIHAGGRIEYINAAVRTFLGYEPEELLHTSFLDHVQEEDRPIAIEQVRKRACGEFTESYVLRFRARDGSTLYGEARGVLVRYRNAMMNLMVIHNVTDRLHLEAELRWAKEELEARVEERTAALKRANEKLLELDQIKTDFLSTVSHELRTPLTSIVGFAKIMRKRFVATLAPLIPRRERKVSRLIEQLQGNFEVIISEGDRLTALINDLLDLSKMEAGKIEWKRDPVDAADLVRKVAAAMEPLCRHKGLYLTTEVERRLPCVSGDRDRLHQVLLNLVANAMKFTREGGVTCGCSLQENRLIFRVTDTGPGIADENRLKIFDKFTQLESALADKARGTGLGLAISRQIAEAHGGVLWVESTPGQGSSFFLSLPISPSEATSP